MIKPTSVLIAIVLFISSCDYKKHSCTSTLCIRNIGTDTIHYTFTSGGTYSDSIMPGNKVCVGPGNLELEDDIPQNSVLVNFESDHGNTTIIVDECNENFDVE